MTSLAYYNEFDPKAAAWLRELINQGLIAPGDVDERSITEIKPYELRKYTQCHFFAGIGVWSHALRNSGWPDDLPIWSASLPCQPWSSAGKREGVNDERHLWPVFFELANELRPTVIFGEQVEGKAGWIWSDLVSNDLENAHYAFGTAGLPACGIGAPHKRQRQYWGAVNTLADTSSKSSKRNTGGILGAKEESNREGEFNGSEPVGYQYGGSDHTLADDSSRRWWSKLDNPRRLREGVAKEEYDSRGSCSRGSFDTLAYAERSPRLRSERWNDEGVDSGGSGTVNSMANTKPEGSQRGIRGGQNPQREDQHRHPGCDSTDHRPGPTNGFWGEVDWIFCRDGKWRPVEPGLKPLVNGAPSELVQSCDLSEQDVSETKEARVMRLKGYGNAIVAPQAQAFIEAFVEALDEISK